MKVNFKQGIVRTKVVSNQPLFLEYDTQGYVNLIIDDVELIVTASDKTSNYLISEPVSMVNAWGPFNWDSNWGVEPANKTYYLYWDINLSSGEVSRGFTPYSCIVNQNYPAYPNVDQHWYDLTNNRMMVWSVS